MIYVRIASITNAVTGVWDSRDPEPELKSERMVPLHEYLHEYLHEKDEKLNVLIMQMVRLADAVGKLGLAVQQLEPGRIIVPS